MQGYLVSEKNFNLIFLFYTSCCKTIMVLKEKLKGYHENLFAESNRKNDLMDRKKKLPN